METTQILIAVAKADLILTEIWHAAWYLLPYVVLFAFVVVHSVRRERRK